MSTYKIKEASFNSLNELNTYIQDNNITPKDMLKYDTSFDQIKNTIRYMIVYWVVE